MALPQLTPAEKSAGLKKAQEMRSQRTLARKKLKKGEIGLHDVFEKVEDDVYGKMRVLYLLESLPRIGKVTAKQVMEEIGIDDKRRVQGLGVRQRDALMTRIGNK